jgi:hypothetical protein
MNYSFAKDSCNNTIVFLARFGSLPKAANQHHIIGTQSPSPLKQNSPL